MNKRLNEKELKKFINNYGLARQLKMFACMLTDKKFTFKLNLGGGSFTDWKSVTIGIPEYAIGKTKEQVLSMGKAMTAHEIEHINSSPREDYLYFVKEFTKYMKDKHDIDEAIGQKVGQYIINSLEDGRIERISTDKFPGIGKYLTYFRSLWWQDCAIKENGDNELFDTLFALCTFATMGLFPKGYVDVYSEKEELYDMVRSIKSPIIKFVNCNDFKKGLNHVWDMIYKIEDWMVDLMKAMPEEELEQQLDNANKEVGDGCSSGGASSSSSSSSSSSDKEDEEEGKTPETHKAFTGEEGKEGKSRGASEEESEGKASGEQTNEWEHQNLDKEVIDERTMESIVQEAMKSAEKEVYEEEHKNVIQADFDDMKKEKEKKEKEAKAEGLNDEEKKEIQDYYRNLPTENRDGDWNSPLKIHKFKFDKVDAPSSIRMESRKVEKQFTQIIMNKASMDAKNRKRGNLNTNQLWKIQNKDFNIFEKKGNPNNTDYVFYILVDGSGSMWGDKYVEAYRATSLLEEALKHHVPLKIAQFDCDSKYVNHYVVKDFDEVEGNKSWAFLNNTNAGNGNMDGYSIRICTKELQKRREIKKVLIVLSDGQPAGVGSYYGGRAERDVKEAIREARRSNIDVFNIMFGEEYQRAGMIDSFKFMYEKGIVSCNPKDISNELLRIVKRELNK